MRVVWTDRAKLRLRELHDYVARESPLVAPQIVRRLVRPSRQLQVAPWSGRRVLEYDRDDIRELMVRPYRIIYLVLAKRVDVLTVRHYRQLMPSELRDL
jgi:plasmid stabilization system protein ParE